MKTHIEFKRYINNDPFQRKEIRFYHFGTKCWFLNGNRHREDGPALTYSNGYKEWFLNGKLHREDGPAVQYIDGTKKWHLEGKEYRYEKEYWEVLEKYKREKNIK